MLKEFREFAVKGNVVDMATGLIVGAAFGTVVKSFVDDLVMPPISLVLGKTDFTAMFIVLREGAKTPAPYESLAKAKEAGAVVLGYGTFLTTVLSFLIVTFSVFLLVKTYSKVAVRSKSLTCVTALCVSLKRSKRKRPAVRTVRVKFQPF
ncbi:MAG: large conductance mechanosensitive channel protein MscL [Polyangiaceae bacterium]